MKKVWVVASRGLLGSDVVRELKMRGIDYVGSTHKEADITDQGSIQVFFKKHSPTHIVNCAANVNVDLAEDKERELAYSVNVLGAENLAKLASSQNVRLVHISTDYVFDGKKEGLYSEEDQTHAINVYGATKLEGEKRIMEMYPEGACSIRTASLYGLEKDGLVTGIVKALQERDVVSHFSDQVSTPTYTKDLAKACVDLLEESGIFHFVNLGFASRLELVEEVKMLADLYHLKIKCREVRGITREERPRPAIRPRRSVLATAKIAPHLSFQNREWQAALAEYFKEKYADF